MAKNPPQMTRLPITQSRDVKPVYANMVRITHMPSEIVFDFALKVSGNAPAQVQAQVLMSPMSAKLFQRALMENISRYEKAFGEIKIPGEDQLREYSKLFIPPPDPSTAANEDTKED